MQVQSQLSGIALAKPHEWHADGRLAERCRQRGFTLVELMITVAVAAVLLMIAVPSFRNVTLSNRLNTAAAELTNAISVARMEAVRRNANTQFCSNSASANTGAHDTLGSACGAESGAVWVMNNGTPNRVLAGTAGLVPPLRVNGNLTALRFSAQGQARVVGAAAPFNDVVADVCTSRMGRDNHRVIRMAAGSILATTATSGDCPSS